MYNQATAFDFTPDALQLVGQARLAYIRKVYTYFGLGLLTAVVGVVAAMNTGLWLIIARSPIIGLIAFIGTIFWASKAASNPARAVPTLMLATFVSGLILSPTLYMIAHGYL